MPLDLPDDGQAMDDMPPTVGRHRAVFHHIPQTVLQLLGHGVLLRLLRMMIVSIAHDCFRSPIPAEFAD
jgi:hypothetical protein